MHTVGQSLVQHVNSMLGKVTVACSAMQVDLIKDGGQMYLVKDLHDTGAKPQCVHTG